ncbi:MAG: DUF1638 domain-containing protein [Verrucomicrobia bacterium]|nr:DUF1638 domain-containing protein [Verrucomicrobiota bacterium]
MKKRFFKIIACEIAVREISFVAAQSPHLVDLEFLTQGLHDIPCTGGAEIQRRIDAVPAGKYDAILLGYGLCGNLLRGLRPSHAPLVIPRAHDCITLLLGSKERYVERQAARVGSYYYSSGWLECRQRRGDETPPANEAFQPMRADAPQIDEAARREMAQKYGEDGATYLLEMMGEWTKHYTHGALIEFDFTRALRLGEQVLDICKRRGWEYEEVRGDLGLLQRWVDGKWDERDFLVVQPEQQIAPCHDERIFKAEAVSHPGNPIAST